MSQWAEGQVTEVIHWTEDLCSIKVAADLEPYQAGQFTKLALDIDGTRVARPYSFVNPPGAPCHEFFFDRVPEGPLSNRLIGLEPGDSVLVARRASGFLVLDEVPDGRELWMLATGTAVGPFLSILKTPDPWQRFDRIVLLYGVSHARDLCYRERIEALAGKHPEHFQWLPCISREEHPGTWHGRITDGLESGGIQQRLGVALDAETSQVMICGNPEMVKSCVALLKAQGMEKNLRSKPGQITVERYW